MVEARKPNPVLVGLCCLAAVSVAAIVVVSVAQIRRHAAELADDLGGDGFTPPDDTE